MNQQGAQFSTDRRRRIALWREWDDRLPAVCWVCLNPSTADERAEDATTRKIRGFSERWGYGAYQLMNIFDLRATDPRELRRHPAADLASPDNFRRIKVAAHGCGIVICAWGRHGLLHGQGAAFVAFARRYPALAKKLRAIRFNMDGTPAHPLMLPYGDPPEHTVSEMCA